MQEYKVEHFEKQLFAPPSVAQSGFRKGGSFFGSLIQPQTNLAQIFNSLESD